MSKREVNQFNLQQTQHCFAGKKLALIIVMLAAATDLLLEVVSHDSRLIPDTEPSNLFGFIAISIVIPTRCRPTFLVILIMSFS